MNIQPSLEPWLTVTRNQSVVLTTIGVVLSSEGCTPTPTAKKTLRKHSAATDGGQIPQVGRPWVAWTRECTRALLSTGKRCNPLKRGFGSPFVELRATANALVQKYAKTLVQN